MSSIPSVAFAGRVTEAQFSSVQSALLPVWARWYTVAPAFAILYVTVGAGWASVAAQPMSALADLGLAAVVLAAGWFIVKYARRRNWRRYEHMHGSIAGTVSPAGFEWKTDVSSTNVPWEKLCGHRFVNDIALIYFAPRCAFFVPRSFVAGEPEWRSLEALLASHSHLA